MKSSCRAGLHREPLNSTSSTFHQVKRVSGMHLKPYLKLQKKERSPEISQDSLRGHQGPAQGEKYANCTKLSVFPKPSLVTPSQKLLGIIYPNTMCNMNGKGPADGPSAREKKNALSATIHQGEEGEGPLDVWAVVKPGNTKEKIAFFAAQQCSSNARTGSMKIKSTWDIDGRTAKRRKKSVDLKKAKIQLERMREANARCSQPEPFACGIEHCSVHFGSDSAEGAFPGRSLSVIEMVAFLEQRASALLVDCAKTWVPARGDGWGEAGVAEAGYGGRCGPLGDTELWDGAASAPQPFPSGLDTRVGNVNSGLAQAVLAMTAGRNDTEAQIEPPRALLSPCPAAARLPPDPLQSKNTTVDCTSKESVIFPKHPARKEPLCISISVTKTDKGCRKEKHSSSSSGEDSLPGRLFFLQGEQPAAHEQQPQQENTQEKPGKVAQNEDEDALASGRSCVRSSVPTEPLAPSVPPTEGALQVLDASCLKRQVSHDFLETRFKIQQLLEPQQYMAFLPHHIIVKIFGLLPTRSLVALKCTCYYFKFIIEYYNIRPADSRWVRDPRYREDPCKQCKKKYVKGDVSLCRWHPKPYCQALPYGPGYWMCCHRSQKGIPGCKLGLHDNHWVPACHSFNRAIHKKTRGAGAEVEEEY
ncbi:F-box only protein 34 [Corvus brachyrhynchos]|uniref:F-box only protein 34 n=1 Tax=Corvus brachyrhynchos TaxID=85066 RepID=A0A091F016_CORBR|nr:PREDICTED: F-box only protein 34 [Corvus brachyrhynchos]KFO61914.1 F-box only protein 34 [Corvus brachyrhynchos]